MTHKGWCVIKPQLNQNKKKKKKLYFLKKKKQQKKNKFIEFLSHLLVAGCDIGVQFSVRPSINIYVDVQHLCQS